MSIQNWPMNAMAVNCLEACGDDHVLEIGFGAGDAIRRLVQRSAAPLVAGVDPSDVMLDQAAAKNAAAVEAGRVMLLQGTASSLPFEDGRFSRVFSVSTFHVWDDREAGLAEVWRVLHDGGRLVLCLRRAARHPMPWSTPGLSRRELEEDVELLKRQEFRNVHVVGNRLHPRIFCLVAQKQTEPPDHSFAKCVATDFTR